MAYVKPDPAAPPAEEPVALADMKEHLRLTDTSLDATVTLLIQAAREVLEGWCRRSFVSKGYIQTLDSFPQYTDTLQSQLAYPPSYYSLPRYSTTLWNYSQMIKLYYGPLISFSSFRYLSSSGSWVTITGTDVSAYDSSTVTDFVFDTVSEPPRIFPVPGQYWQPTAYAPNAVEMHYQSGLAASAAALPANIKLMVRMLAAHWFENPEATSSKNLAEAPMGVQSMVWSNRVADEAPTRG